MDVPPTLGLPAVAPAMQLPGIRGKGRTIMGDPEDGAQQPAPDPAQPDEGGQQPTPPDDAGAEPDNTWEGKPEGDEGGIQPDNTWEG